MKICLASVLFVPALLWAQEFQFRQEYDTIPVEISGWSPFVPWAGGFAEGSPDFADVDADGDFDLFMGNFNFFGWVAYLNNAGTVQSPFFAWVAAQYDSLHAFAGHTAPELADLDADGDLDALIGSGYVTYVQNIGNNLLPNFNSTRDTLFDISNNWIFGTHVAVCDIDADADLDLIGGEWMGHLQFYRNIGTSDSAAFYLESNPWLGINVGAQADPTFCDIDADGDLDIFIGNQIGRIYFYRNDGDSINYNFTYMTDFYNSIDVGGHASPEFADIDGDGDYDLFVGREQTSTTTDPGDIFFYENIGTPQVAQWNLVTKNYISLDVGYTAHATTTDIDADQDRDLFIQHQGDSLSYYENVGLPDSAAYVWITNSYQGISVDDAMPKFCDIDGDGDPDLFMGAAAIPGPPGMHLFQNRGTPQNAQFTLSSNDFLPGVFTQFSVALAPSLADLDGDFDYDIFICDQDTSYFFPNSGSPLIPQFGSPIYGWQNLQQPAGRGEASCWNDIDQDGDLDLFWCSSNGYMPLWFYRNQGTAQNPQLVLESQSFLPMEGLHSFLGIDIFDIDQDGDDDFMLSTGSGGGMMFFRNITGEVSAPPPVQQHPRAGVQISLGPNPANPFVVASFELRVASNMSLDVYDLLGRRVVELASGFHLPGEYRYVWDAGNSAAGMYIIRLQTPQQSLSQKLTIIK